MHRSARFWQRFVLAERGAFRRYGVAVALALASLLVVRLLQATDRIESTSIAFATTVLSAIYGGFGPALTDTALTALGIDYLFSEPRYVIFDSWASAAHILVHGAVGGLIADIVATLRDAYFETEAARRAREDILAVVSHDLRSPLAAILLNAGYVKRAGGAEVQAAAESVQRSTEQMSRLIEDLLDAVRIEKGQLGLRPGVHELAPIVAQAAEGVRLAAEAKGVVLELAPPPAGCRVRADRERLAQVLANLLGNAVKFSPEGGRVELEARCAEGEVALAVRDYGPGIAEAELPRIFDRYWQARGTAHQGTGLGLFIAKSIVEGHGGRLEVRSRAGEGCVFTVVLPS